MNQGVYILTITFFIYCILSSLCFALSDRANNDKLIDKLKNVSTTDDVDEARSLSSEFKSRYLAAQGITNENKLIYYVEPKRNSITFIFYYLIDRYTQDLICKIINDIRVEKHLNKKLLIQFYKNENIIQDPNNPRIQLRKNEELLRAITLENK